MPRVHYVKSARKDNPVAKTGEPYYWWKANWGPKRFSKTRPKPSQLTNSEYLSGAMSIGEDLQEALNNAGSVEDVKTAVEEAIGRIEEIRDETQDKLDNMPDGLKEGPTGELLQNRVDAMEEWQNELEALDTDVEPDDDQTEEDLVAGLVDEISGIEPNLE